MNELFKKIQGIVAAVGDTSRNAADKAAASWVGQSQPPGGSSPGGSSPGELPVARGGNKKRSTRKYKINKYRKRSGRNKLKTSMFKKNTRRRRFDNTLDIISKFI